MYVKFIVSMRDTWVLQSYCIFGGLVEMCEVVSVELYSKLIGKIMGIVCEAVAGFYMGLFLLDVGNRVKLNLLILALRC